MAGGRTAFHECQTISLAQVLMSLRCESDTVLLPFPALARVLYSHVLIQVQLHCLEIDSIFKCFLGASNPEAHPRKVSQYR